MIWLSLALAASCEVVVYCDGVQVGAPVPLPPAPTCEQPTGDTGTYEPRSTEPTGDTGDTGATSTTPARIVLVLLDDVGYGALTTQTPYAHPVPPAPRLDALAASGRRFTHALAAPNCSPARAALLTGREGARDRVDDHGYGLPAPAGAAAWPAAFRDAGWATHYAGKWHLTGVSGSPGVPVLAPTITPTVAGFQTWIASEGEVNDGAFLVADETGAVIELTGETSDVYLSEALAWLEAQSGPALSVVALSAGHSPYVAPQSDLDAFAGYIPQADARGYWAEVRAADRAVGAFADALDAGGLLHDTLLIVTSDNGAKDNPGFAGHPNGGLAGFKGTVEEGAIRVPMVAHWPSGGLSGVASEPIAFVDLGHTLTGLAGVSWGHLTPTDGVDAGELLLGAPYQRPTGIGHTRPDGDRAWTSADGTWKLEQIDGVTYLYDLITDPGASVDVSATYPTEVAALTADLAAWDASVVQSSTCADYPGADCGFVRVQKAWTTMTPYHPYRGEWCARPEFSDYQKCETYR